jgi:hypothetical protein
MILTYNFLSSLICLGAEFSAEFSIRNSAVIVLVVARHQDGHFQISCKNLVFSQQRSEVFLCYVAQLVYIH